MRSLNLNFHQFFRENYKSEKSKFNAIRYYNLGPFKNPSQVFKIRKCDFQTFCHFRLYKETNGACNTTTEAFNFLLFRAISNKSISYIFSFWNALRIQLVALIYTNFLGKFAMFLLQNISNRIVEGDFSA